MHRPVPFRMAAAWLAVALAGSACTGGEASPTTSSSIAVVPAAGIPSTTTTVAQTPELPVAIERSGEAELTAFDPGGLVRQQVEELVTTVERLRGLAFIEPPPVHFVAPAEASRVRAAEPPTAPGDATVALAELLVPRGGPGSAGTDGSASGLPVYDALHRDVVVPLDAQLLTPFEQWALIGELTKALTHQRFPDLVDAAQLLDPDAELAREGFLAGSAAFVQSLFLAELDPTGQEAVVAGGTRLLGSGAVGAGLLEDVRRTRARAGSWLVAEIYGLGGLVALDQASQIPPATTEQLLHPDRYVALESPRQVDPPTVDVLGHDVVEQGTWGELRLRTMIAGSVNGGVAHQASTGWAGDGYTLMWNPRTRQVTWVARLEMESTQDASELAAAFIRMAGERLALEPRLVAGDVEDFVGDDYVAVGRIDDTVTVVIADDPAPGLAMAVQLGLIPEGFEELPPPAEESDEEAEG